MIIRHVPAGQVCCDPVWEAAYARFETPEEEVAKFIDRLRWFGVPSWNRDLEIVELFCGRGGALRAWNELGFTRLQGVDLSERLLEQYTGEATLHLADCRQLPFESGSLDVLSVHGGLHHLPSLPEDLQRVLSEARRVLKPHGRFLLVEPWWTPFLRMVHAVVSRKLVRRLWSRGDALAVMTEREADTYFRWLSMPEGILDCLRHEFEPQRIRRRWGKLYWLGIPRH